MSHPRAGGGATLPRPARLRDQEEFQRLFQSGARLERESFVLLWRPAAGRRTVGFAAGRRLGGSVVRNRARRRLREAYRLHQDLVPPVGVRLCLVARRGALRAPFTELARDLAAALSLAARRLAS